MIAKRNTNRSLIKDAFDIEEDEDDDAIDESQLLTVQQILTAQQNRFSEKMKKAQEKKKACGRNSPNSIQFRTDDVRNSFADKMPD